MHITYTYFGRFKYLLVPKKPYARDMKKRLIAIGTILIVFLPNKGITKLAINCGVV
jgi:hypothetical protein